MALQGNNRLNLGCPKFLRAEADTKKARDKLAFSRAKVWL